MTESSKYDLFLGELHSLETQVSILVEQLKEFSKANRELETQLNHYKKENEHLKQHINSFEKDFEVVKGDFEKEVLFGSLTSKERESIKQKISDLINRINLHLQSS